MTDEDELLRRGRSRAYALRQDNQGFEAKLLEELCEALEVAIRRRSDDVPIDEGDPLLDQPELAPAPVALQIRAVAATPLRGAVRFRTSAGSEHLVEGEIGKGIRVPPGATILDFGLLSTYQPGDTPAPGHSISGHLPNPPK